ncbi:MAG: ABC transporter ATP-binding protein, partial [Saprospiraceae bacterium]
YLGDVNYFLEKRKLEDMRQVEMSSKSTPAASPTTQKAPQLSYAERKQLQRTVQKTEKEVHRLEKLIGDLEAQMAQPDFFTKPTHQNTLKQHNQAQVDLEKAMEAWMEAQEQLETSN